MFDPTLSQITRYGADAFVRLAHTVSVAEEIQWDASPTGHPRGSTSYSDPTGDVVADPKRLAVREQVEEARARLMEAAEAARAANAALTAAIEEWQGTD